MPKVPAEHYAAAQRMLRICREERDTAKGLTEAEICVMTVDAINAELLAALKETTSLLASMFSSKKLEFSLVQEDVMKEKYGLGMQAIAIAEGQL